MRSVEEEQDEEEDEAQAANDHPRQQEAVAALNLNDLKGRETERGV